MPKKRKILDRAERRHPGPILEEVALLQRPPQQIGVVRTKPGEKGELMSPLDDVDRVDLEDAHGAHRPTHVADVRRASRPRSGKTLGGEGGSPRLRPGEAPHLAVDLD
jgi:hypothetical protein